MNKIRKLCDIIIGMGAADLVIIALWLLFWGRAYWGATWSDLEPIPMMVFVSFVVIAGIEIVLVFIMETMYRKTKRVGQVEEA